MFAKNVRFLRKKNGLLQSDLADNLNLVSATVSKWEKGISTPNMSTLIDIANFFNLSSVNDLIYKDLEKEDELIRKGEVEHQETYIRIPVYSHVHAGIFSDMVDDIQDYEDIPERLTRGGKEYFALTVKGDSMSPRYEDGDTIIVRKQPDCESGDDCVVQINNDEATLKKVYKSNGVITLQSINPTYPPRSFTGNSDEPELHILGVIVELRRKIR